MPESRRVSKVVLSEEAQLDVALIAKWSRDNFGRDAANRYRRLIRQALADIASDPERPGSKIVRCSLDGVRTYHLSLSRQHVVGRRVGSPRHLIVYRRSDRNTVSISRILHDSFDLPAHLAQLGD